MEDWEKNPENYQTNSDGSFICKKDGTPKRKGGRPKGAKGRGYNYHSETKAKIQARRAIRKTKKEAERTRVKLSNQRDKLKASKETLEKLDKDNKNKIITDDVLSK